MRRKNRDGFLHSSAVTAGYSLPLRAGMTILPSLVSQKSQKSLIPQSLTALLFIHPFRPYRFVFYRVPAFVDHLIGRAKYGRVGLPQRFIWLGAFAHAVAAKNAQMGVVVVRVPPVRVAYINNRASRTRLFAQQAKNARFGVVADLAAAFGRKRGRRKRKIDRDRLPKQVAKRLKQCSDHHFSLCRAGHTRV